MTRRKRSKPTDFDDIPIRLPSGGKALVRLPRPFTLADGVHLVNFLENYIEHEMPPSDHGTSTGESAS